ncbi:hypothetical protein C2E23DRAFT_871177 [Lenzites betulinus]|nr:hypothetical protein C2E23DRAFT_871177 [Lenzites betulinus]
MRPPAYPKWPEVPLVQPENWRNLPSKLVRPDFPEIKPEFITSAQPEYAGLSARHIRSGWAHVNYRVMGMYRKVYIDPPKAALPSGFNLLLSDLGLVNCSSHLFGVYAPIPPQISSDPAARLRKCALFRRKVDLYPTHAAVWAAYCAHLPQMHQHPTKLKVYRETSLRTGRASVLRLPVVAVPVPHPESFHALLLFVYTYRKSALINALLPVVVIPPDPPVEPPRAVLVARHAQALARACDLLRLCQLAKNVHGAYRNMVALGVVEDRMWDALEHAWATVLAAMELKDPADAAEAAASG